MRWISSDLPCSCYPDSASRNTFHYTYDLNGNVSEVLDGSGTIAAHYEYGPFGELIHEYISPGFSSSIFSFQFSTKYHDRETGLLYYGLRWYRLFGQMDV
jgi:uncharacterized protein RhaS with RHS repeats